MAERKPLYRDGTTGVVTEMASGDTMQFGAYIRRGHVTATSALSRTANTFVTVSGMTFTMAETGSAWFIGLLNSSNGNVNGQGQFAIFKNGSQVADSTSDLISTTSILGLITLSTNAIKVPVVIFTELTFVPTDIIDLRYRSVNGESIAIDARHFMWARVAA